MPSFILSAMERKACISKAVGHFRYVLCGIFRSEYRSVMICAFRNHFRFCRRAQNLSWCLPTGRQLEENTGIRCFVPEPLKNQVYIAGVNCAGSMCGQYYSGDSIVYAPDGTAVPAKRRNVPGNEQIPEEAIFLLEIDNNITKYREEFPVKKDRREELYRKLGST